MALELRYDDKYRLWNALLRGNTDRLFVAADERIRLGEVVPVHIHVGEASLPIVVKGTVVGLREASRRFCAGGYLKIADKELEKFRRYLGLQPVRGAYDQTRHALRVHHEFPVRFAEPRTSEIYTTKNVSETGLFITCPADLHCGQRVSLYLVLNEMPLALEAEVVWQSAEQGVAGLHIAEIGERAAARLRDAIESVHKDQLDARVVKPILVADDEPAIITLITKTLEINGCDVYHCGNGDEALDLIRELHPKLVLMDILMPGTDGAEICKVMRADAELADIKVIFLSALGEEVLHTVADEAGANDYLAKPLRIAELTEMVKHYLAS